MIDYAEELKYYKQKRDEIKAEINDLQGQIVVESGRGNRNEVNHCRERINRLKMKLNDISYKIAELEKQAGNNSLQVLRPNSGLTIPPIDDGTVTITDSIEIEGGDDRGVNEIINIQYVRKVKIKNGKKVSEVINETKTTTRLFEENIDYIDARVLQ